MKEFVRFKILIECAKKYINEKAKIIADKNGTKTVLEVVEKKYSKPKDITQVNEEEKLDMIIERFCIELQNYQAMPKAIDYAYYGKGYTNKIFTLVKRIKDENLKVMEIYEKLHDECKFEEEKEISKINVKLKDKVESYGEKITQEKINNAWLRYSIGIFDVLNFIKYKENCKDLYEVFNREKNGKLNTEILKGRIYYLGESLKDDFFKELGRDDLMKPDIHMIKLMNAVTGEILSKDKTSKYFLEYCEELKYKPYYIDKLLWLCCTGTFYNDDIICTNMSRKGLLEKTREEWKKKNL